MSSYYELRYGIVDIGWLYAVDASALLLGTHSLLRAQDTQKSYATAKTTEWEEIYVARSVRE
jgi:hypothetical protein